MLPARCRGKVIYDKKGATTAKNKRFHDDHIALRIYPCEVGNHWHLTSQQPFRNSYKKQYGKNRT